MAAPIQTPRIHTGLLCTSWPTGSCHGSAEGAGGEGDGGGGQDRHDGYGETNARVGQIVEEMARAASTAYAREFMAAMILSQLGAKLIGSNTAVPSAGDTLWKKYTPA